MSIERYIMNNSGYFLKLCAKYKLTKASIEIFFMAMIYIMMLMTIIIWFVIL